ncbi:ABC transporter ATP-binding protein [Actinophytocola sp.]|uniref:ABC transporter ATP-binding protein n=1 Tax=Actinophytocola sp. TaxID=1872138 RepID=UPI002D6605E9|nr:ABC transporter ATP-binding protein [Actinophytocola sp.]HYQ61847.1 ABC transporter ATP-binding protein [Actinophytocola sp.]
MSSRFAGVVTAVGLAWRAAPGLLAVYLPLNVLGAVVPVASAWLVKLVLDSVLRGTPLYPLLLLVGALAVVGLVAGVVPHVTEYVRVEADRRVTLLSEDRLYGATERFVGLGRFEDPGFQDTLRVAQESGRSAPSNVVNGFVGVGRALVTIAGFVGSLAVLDPLITAVVLLAGVPAVLAERALARRRAAVFLEMSPSVRRELFYARLLTDIRAAKEVRLFGTSGFFRHRMLRERATADAAERRVDRQELRVQGGLSLLSSVVAGGGLVVAIVSASRGQLSVGDVSMFVAAVAGVQTSLSMLVGAYAMASRSLLMFEHYRALLDAGPDLPVAAEPAVVGELRGSIELRDVWFRYSPAHPWVLRGVNMVIPAGRAVAIVGRNGAGKSTIVKLLCRFYDPTRGSVRWDGVDLRDISPADLRARIGAVFQDFMEYDLTAAENIGIGDVGRRDDRPRVEAAARLAGVHETLARLPGGYDTLLSRTFTPGGTASDESAALAWLAGDDTAGVGVTLSTGQWQRLALARGLFRGRRDLLILDEPSSGLDPEAEHQVHGTLRTYAAGTTRVLISHRLGATRDADHVFVIEDGVVSEQGTHTELVSAGGAYARLFALQAKGYQEPSAVG